MWKERFGKLSQKVENGFSELKRDYAKKGKRIFKEPKEPFSLCFKELIAIFKKGQPKMDNSFRVMTLHFFY